MNRGNIEIAGGAWITASGIGNLSGGDAFAMSDGKLPKLNKELLSPVPESRWGRLDYYTKAGLVAASLAVKDSGVDMGSSAAHTAIVASTVSGSLKSDHEYMTTVVPDGGLLASPNLFAYTLASCMLGEISIRYGITGPAMIIGESSVNMLNGILVGTKLIAYGQCEWAIAGYCNTDVVAGRDTGDSRLGAVFLLLHKSDKKNGLSVAGNELWYDDRRLSDLIDLMKMLTCKNRRN
jgi:3-oxoacyl-[acyl-carrier-protein] synthase II